MIRKILAVILTIFTLYAIKETVVIFTSGDVEIVSHRKQLILIALSITIPLVVLSLWLWRPKTPNS
ncbi:hypothetical protein [Pedobacter frigiditerrae]|uniref:hypothetical protein n=1 Tax=Pedobacter frigiditerrae TaxID=2530452 RepID=UPI002930E562|nr:hypothetical protein [Pedobacter frigiditerrae]